MATNLEIAGAVKRTQKGDADWYYGGDNEAWPDMATALANIPSSVRPGKTIGVFSGTTIVEYWWPTEAVADINLIPKTPDLSAYATTSYVDSSLISAMKLRGDWDISSGAYPANGGSGTDGAVKEGNAWRISVPGTIGTQTFDTGDFIVALCDVPAQSQTNWTVLEHNDQQATETTAGITKIAIQTDIQNETTINDTDTVTPKKFWQGISHYASIAWTIIGDRIFQGLVSILKNVPELRFITTDSAYARFQRTTISNNNLFQAKNDILQVGGIGAALNFTALPAGQVLTFDGSFFTSLSSIISLWYRPVETISQNIIYAGSGSTSNYWVMYTDSSGQLQVRVQGANGSGFGTYGTIGPILTSGSTYNIVLYYVNTGSISGTTKLFVNNVEYTIQYAGGLTSLPLGTGATVTVGSMTSGVVDQLLIYDSDLSSTDRTANYNSGAGVSSPVSTNLIRQYDFEEGTGITAYEKISGTHNGTLANGLGWTINGITPVIGNSSEATFFASSDGLTNGERGVATWGDFNGRNQQQGKWFQWFQNNIYPLVSNNSGQFLFNPHNTSNLLPNIASTVDIAGNLTIGSSLAGNTEAPANGLQVQGQANFEGNATFLSYANATGSTPEIRWTTDDTQHSKLLRRVDLSNNQFEARNNVLQVGGIGKAIICGGDTQQAAFNYPTTITDTFSQSVWFKSSYNYSAAGSENSIISFVGSYGNWFWLRVNQNNTLSACVSGQITTAFTINDGKWHNVVYTQNSLGTGNFYVDNVLIGTAVLSANIMAGNGYLGYTAPGIAPLDAKPFIGQIDQYLLYNTILTSTDVSTIYNSGAGTANPPTTGLIRRYEFEEGTGTTTADINPNIAPSDALLNNGVTWSSIGIIPVMGGAAEMVGFKFSDGLTNGERGIATWGDFNGRNQQQGRWFQFFQNISYPLVSNNSGQWLFDPNNINGGLPAIASTIDIAGNLTIGRNYSNNDSAPDDGLLIQGNTLLGTTNDNITDRLQINGNLSLINSGDKLKIATGNNSSIGTATLSNGIVTINTTAVTSTSIIIFCVKSPDGTQGFLSQGSIIPETSFTINSTESNDNSLLNWLIIN